MNTFAMGCEKMKKALLFLAAILMIQSSCLAASVQQLPVAEKTDLRQYQQAQGTLNVIAAPFDGAQMYIGAFNFGRQENSSAVTFSRGIALMNLESGKMYPLLIKKVSGTSSCFSEQLINKDGTEPYKQSSKTVQTDSSVPIAYIGGDADSVVLTGRFAVNTAGGSFSDCIGVKIYNSKTGEGLIQYLAKGHGIVYLEGVRADGSTVPVAELHEIKTMNDAAAADFKQQYFK